MEITAQNISPAWLTAQFRVAGVLQRASVTEFTPCPIGNGLVGSSVRFDLCYDEAEPGAPASVVGKFPSAEPTNREAANFMRLYMRESCFYRDIAQHTAIRTPRTFANLFDPETHEFLLLLEDLSPARGGDQLRGCSAEDAATALRQVALLHAPFWGDPKVDALDWLGLPPMQTARIATMAVPAVDMFCERFGTILEPEVIGAVMQLKGLTNALMSHVPSCRTVLHGDFRLDNLLFDAAGGSIGMATLDWQTVARGCGTQDAAYFIGAGMKEENRGEAEDGLMRIYHESLCASGVRNYGWAQCWHDYRKHSVNGLFMAMFSAISVARTERGDAVFATMARRHALQALELDGFALWA